MKPYQHEFIEFCLAHEVLRFGEFTLKSDRVSPYFFNTGLFNTGETIARLGEFYAKAIQEDGVDFDVLFGPAYKGIPLVTSVSIALNHLFNRNLSYAFNRKEKKDHGEGGNIVGAKLQGRVLMIDDVITAGTAVRESMQIVHANQAKLVGICVAMDRQERGQTDKSAIQEIEEKYHTKVICIIKLEHLLEYVAQEAECKVELKEALKKLYAYRDQYGEINMAA